MPAVEVGPQRGNEDELGIGRLPQQEVAGALLAGGADEQVDVGHVGLVEVPGDHALVDLGRIDASRRHLARDPLCRIGDLGSAAVVDAHREGEIRVAGRQPLGFLELVDDRLPQAWATARPPDSDTEIVHLVSTSADHITVEAHEETDLVR